jgi:hypothetical protein
MHPVITEEAAKAKAKALRKALADKGVELNHQACIDVISRVEGEKGWAALNAKQNCPIINNLNKKEKPKLDARKLPPRPRPVDYQEYPFEVVYRNPEGNRIHEEMFKTAEEAYAAQSKWQMQGSGWGAEVTELVYINGIAYRPEEVDEFDYKHRVQFTRPDGSQYIDRFPTETIARGEAQRWANFEDPVVHGEYLGVEK